MKLVLALISSTLVISQLSGCSWLFGEDGTFRDRSNDYRKAKIEAPLELPAGIESESLDDSYAIPVINDRTTLDAVFVIPRPEALSEDIDRDSVRINTLADQRWILVDGAPGQVWPRLRGFLSLNQLAVERIDATSGLMETAWLQPTGEGVLRERYRLRIEQGVQRGTSEVYILQADLRAGLDSWPAQSSNLKREKIMVEGLAQYLADSSAAASVSMLAQESLDSSGKVTLEESNDAKPYIKLKLTFSRAWPSVGLALEKAGYTVDDLNRDEKLYYVHYLEQEEDEDEDGFFSWLWNWGESAEEDENDPGLPYFIRMKSIDENTVSITIERQNGEAMDNKQTSKLLKLIKKHIA